MIEIKDKRKCSGCGACAGICPQNCIKMSPDQEGFSYPEVDVTKCIGCGKCEKVCPVLNTVTFHSHPHTMVARTKDRDLLKKCTSGGVFTAMAKACTREGGIAFGAVYLDSFEVVHSKIETEDEVEKLAGSKYVQSNMDGVYPQIREALLAKKDVIFCGTPCQVAGLNGFLGKSYDNLLLVDLVCHGVPSPTLWKKYLEYIQTSKGQLRAVNFRGKSFGYHVTVMEETFCDGKVLTGSARTNLMSKCYFKNIADRPICYHCPFKTVSRVSDLTLFDSWHASELVKEITDDDMGYTNILIHTEKGRQFLNTYGNDLILFSADTEKALSLDGKMATSSVAEPLQREVFYQMLEEKGIKNTVDELIPISRKDYLIEKSKRVLCCLGILNVIKKRKSKRERNQT